MPKLSEIKPASRFFGLFAGESGSGKTCAEVSFPKKLKVFDHDLRIRGALGAASFVPDLAEVECDIYPPSRPLSDLFDALNILEIEYLSRNNPYQTLIFDSLTSESRFFLSDVMELTGGRIVGAKKDGHGGIRIAGPADHNIKDQAIYRMFDTLRSLPCNVIVSAHIVPKWGLPEGKKDTDYVDRIIVGEELSLTSKLAANILIYFNEVYVFSREKMANGSIGYFVEFRGSLARTTFPQLPDGKVNITNVNFYDWWLRKINEGIESNTGT